jgi:hypothetical protein
MATPIQSPAKCPFPRTSPLRFWKKFNLYILYHQPYCLDFALSDFHLFLHLKKHLAGKKFEDDEEVQEEFMTWFKGQAANFYDSGVQKLVPRLNKCLEITGDYVVK